MVSDQLALLIPAFIYIFVIVDPMASLPIFISLTKNMDKQEMKTAAKNAVLIAGIIALVFLIAGNQILSILKIDISSFKIAGGIVLGLLGLETVLGLPTSKENSEEVDGRAIVTLIATPMLTGPGLITALIIMVEENGLIVPAIATALALFISWLIFDNAYIIKNLIGVQSIEISTKVFGLFLVAIGVSYIKTGFGV